MLKILMFSVSIGAGHDLAAKSFAEQILREHPDAQIEIIDTFRYINPVLNKVVSGTYMETIKFTPKVWGYLYDQAENEKLVDFGQLFNKLLSPKLKHLLNDFQPDLLVCSHAFPCGMLSLLKERENLDLPLLAIITDYTIHPFWLHPHVDRYVVPSELLIDELRREGIDQGKIWSTGLPIREMFTQQWDKAKVRQEMGLEHKPTILIMGGGLGLGNIETIVKTLDAEPDDWQLLVVTGKNAKLKSKLEAYHCHKTLRVYGFVEDMAKIMAASDLTITKPGGMTTAETLAMRLPMVIVSPIPGQEYRNTSFLLNHGVAVMVEHPSRVGLTIKHVLQNPLRLRQMQEMAAYLGKPRAAVDLWLQLRDYCLPKLMNASRD